VLLPDSLKGKGKHAQPAALWQHIAEGMEHPHHNSPLPELAVLVAAGVNFSDTEVGNTQAELWSWLSLTITQAGADCDAANAVSSCDAEGGDEQDSSMQGGPSRVATVAVSAQFSTAHHASMWKLHRLHQDSSGGASQRTRTCYVLD
jgi:hypothetical protein